MDKRAKEIIDLLDAIKPVIEKYLSKDELVSPPNYVNPEVFTEQLRAKGLLDLPKEPKEHEIIRFVQDSVSFSIKTLSPRFLDKLYAAASPLGILSEFIIALLNTNVHTYAVSPFFSIVEVELLKELGKLFQLGDESGGCFCPGGAYSNLHAMLTARNAMFPEVTTKGMLSCSSSSKTMDSGVLSDILPYRYDNKGPLVIFTSSHSHFSVLRSAITIGIGSDNVRAIPIDEKGCMDIVLLERAIISSIEAGEKPFFVNGTAGTTVFGAFDDFVYIGKICRKYGLWFHVDGSYGGSLIFLNQAGSKKLNGIELAHSVTMNPHKLLGVPLLCSALIMKDKNIMNVNSVQAEYLFHEHNEYDIGNKMIGCGRKPDAFKLYLSWIYYGKDGFSKRLEHSFRMVEYTVNKLKSGSFRGKFCLVVVPSFLSVCFWYVPPSKDLPENVKSILGDMKDTNLALKLKNLEEKEKIYIHEFISNITKTKHEKLINTGKFMVDYATVDLSIDEQSETVRNHPYFFRLVFNSPLVEESLIDELLNLIDAL